MCDAETLTILLTSKTVDLFNLFIGPEEPQSGVANYVRKISVSTKSTLQSLFSHSAIPAS